MRKTVYLFVIMLFACLVLQAQNVDNQNMVFVEGGIFMMVQMMAYFMKDPAMR